MLKIHSPQNIYTSRLVLLPWESAFPDLLLKCTSCKTLYPCHSCIRAIYTLLNMKTGISFLPKLSCMFSTSESMLENWFCFEHEGQTSCFMISKLSRSWPFWGFCCEIGMSSFFLFTLTTKFVLLEKQVRSNAQ